MRERDCGALLIRVEWRDASRIVDTEFERMNIRVNLDNIPSVREHARQARVDMLLTMFAGKFGADAERPDLATRLAGMDADRLEAVALRLVGLDDIDAVLDGVSSGLEPGAGPKR